MRRFKHCQFRLYSCMGSMAREKGVYTTTVHCGKPSFLGQATDSEFTEQIKAMVYTLLLGKQRKRQHAIGPERRVYTTEASFPGWWCILFSSIVWIWMFSLCFYTVFNNQDGKSSLKLKFLGRIFLGHQGPRRPDIPDPDPGMSRTKTLCKVPFPVVDRAWQGCPAIWVGTSRDQKSFMHEDSALVP